MQLSKQFFSLCCYFFLFHCLCLCHPSSPPPPPPSLSLPLSLYIFRLISPFLYIFVTFMCASKYIYYSFSLTVCSYFFVFFRVRPLSLYVSLSLSVHLSDSLYLSFYVFVLCLFSIVSISVFPPLSHFLNLGPMKYDLFSRYWGYLFYMLVYENFQYGGKFFDVMNIVLIYIAVLI